MQEQQVIWVAYACMLSFQRGNEGNLSILLNTKLADYYKNSLNAMHFGKQRMVVVTTAVTSHSGIAIKMKSIAYRPCKRAQRILY